MTTLDKLSISGVRSYDPAEAVVIKFYKPLTIIIGRNGSGKTTIIESLKYACTGEVPPGTDRGKSFINDPKAAGQSVVKAQIRVAFKTGSGKPVIAVNSMQLTQKRGGTQTFKTLEGLIRTLDENNRETTLTHRCADMKKLVPNLMGISKAILENVIFCHQEDSCWPLTTSKDLKQRFDDIFAASRYTKALKKMADFRKDQNANIKEMIGEYKVLREQKDQMDKIQDDLSVVKERILESKKSQERVKAEIAQGEADLAPLNEKVGKINKISMKIRELESSKRALQKQKDEAFATIRRDFDRFSDEVLAQKKENVEEKRAIFQKQSDEASVKVDEINSELVKQRSRSQRFNQNKGKMAAQIEANVKRRKTLNQKIKDISTRHGISGYDKSEFEDNEIFKFVKEIEHKGSQKGDEYRRMVAEYQKDENNQQRDLQEILNQKSALEGEIKSLQSAVAEYRRKSQDQSNELNRVTRNLASSFADIEEVVRAGETKLNEKKRAINSSQISEKLGKVARGVEKNNKTLRDLRVSRDKLKSQESAVTRVQVLESEVQKMESDFTQKYESAEGDIVEILEDLPDVKVLETEFKKKIRDIDYNCKSKRRELSEKNTNIASLKTRLKMTSAEVKKLNRKLTEITNKLHSNKVDPDESINVKINESEIKRKKCMKELQLFEVVGDLYRKYERHATDSNKCPICMRKFKENEKQKFLEQNKRRIKKIEDPGALQKKQEAVTKVEEALKTMQRMRPAYEDYQRIKGELKENKDMVERIQQKFKSSSESFEQLKRLEAKAVLDLEKAQKVQKTVAEISQIQRMIKSKQASLEASKRSLQEMAGSGQSLKDIEDEMDSLRTRNEELNRRRTQLGERKEADQQELRDLESNVWKAKDRLKEKNHMQERKSQLEQMVQDLDKQKRQSAERITRADNRLDPLKHKLQKKKTELDLTRSNNQTKTNQKREEVNKFNDDLKEMRKLKSDIDNFAQKEVDLQRLIVELDKNMESVNKLVAEEAELRTMLRQLTPQLNECATLEQDIRENFNYRKLKRNVAEMQDDLVKKRADLENVGDCDEIADQMTNLQKMLEDLRAKASNMKGASGSERQRAVSLMQQLKVPKFQHLEERFRKQMIDVQTAQMAQSDIDQFQKALDKALISFHKEKMKEINTNLKDLWQRCYCGQDIDFVQIRSETATSKKKAYNYCVVMHRGDAELEMRGRCSAGQRVLACLLIRLALAETFGVKCGLMALDEPTTNLDGANIKALAFALTQIIRRRQSQKNFQLILITHDETFVEHLGQRSFCDFYYRVFKDHNQHSKATRHRFNAPEKAVEVKMGKLGEKDKEEENEV